jgi:ATP-binding protein involved in chromosome partitioning
MTTGRPTPQEQARLDAIKRQWQQKRRVTDHMGRIRHKLAVYSGKGGVGKTTVAVNIAVTLASQGARVGILDADIDCPNVVRAMQVEGQPTHSEEGFVPAEQWGVKVLSMGFFQQNPDDAIIFRGPMIHNAITQFLEGTDWGDMDYLVTDLPPGTSDAALTIMQTMPLDGFVVVTAPQELARLDARRSLNMIRKMNVPVLGVVENFSGEIFGTGAGEELAREAGVPFLGAIELRADYRDPSKPTVLLSDAVRAEFEAVVGGLKASLESVAAAS